MLQQGHAVSSCGRLLRMCGMTLLEQDLLPAADMLACASRFLDAYAGKTVYLPVAALENRARRTEFPKLKFVKYNITVNPLADIGASVITVPDPSADWGNFTLVDLDGNTTYPMLTTACVASAKDLVPRSNQGAAQKQVCSSMLSSPPLSRAAWWARAHASACLADFT